MNKWNVDQISSQSGKVAVITGANSGIGYETALGLAKKDLVVILACRNLQKAQEAESRIIKDYPKAQIQTMQLDLSSLNKVREFANQFKSEYGTLDLLINNAGIMMPPLGITVDGFENQFATNYLGHFALTGLLLSFLTGTPNSRVVTVSSLSYKWAQIRFDDFHFSKGYSRRKAYGQSKRACLLFAYELQRRLFAAGSGTLSVAAHPGLSKTNLDRYFPSFVRPLGNFFLQTATKGALPVLYAALEKSISGGAFFGPNGFREMRGDPKRVDSDKDSKDRSIAERLWNESQAMTGVYYLDDKS
jgi:NAD(P)-dependent dehydrogenase (short-subunit alcohol dehydrogenase family)